MTPGWSSLLWFGAVLALIPLALWLLKRTPLGAAAQSGTLRSVAVLPLGAAQRVAVVEIGAGAARRWLVLGVTAQSVTTLHTMEPQAEAGVGSTTPGQGPAFVQLLARLRREP
jgi:flagellar protein FliO/FliZ